MKRLTTCEAARKTCEAARQRLQDQLDAITADPDGDRVPAVLDLCLSTPAGAAIDERGCSQDQFCRRINLFAPSGAAICRRADWKSDEPRPPIPTIAGPAQRPAYRSDLAVGCRAMIATISGVSRGILPVLLSCLLWSSPALRAASPSAPSGRGGAVASGTRPRERGGRHDPARAGGKRRGCRSGHRAGAGGGFTPSRQPGRRRLRGAAHER